MFGCALNWKFLVSPLRTCTLRRAVSESVTRRDRSPLTSMFCSTPSRSIWITSFSSTVTWIPSVITVGCLETLSMTMRSGSSISPSAFIACSSSEVLPIALPPSCMPLPAAGRVAAAAALACSTMRGGSGSRYALDGPKLSAAEEAPGPPTLRVSLSRSDLALSICSTLRFISSFASLILLCRIMLWSFSSCDSISTLVRICWRLMFSR
mmetsp:Transcript_15791/g.27224  ORF Transcript_15791/g.27224 Transcript_15791/m.27224 type:complete len:209 (+) Transcript_15791:585-1211(+)